MSKTQSPPAADLCASSCLSSAAGFQELFLSCLGAEARKRLQEPRLHAAGAPPRKLSRLQLLAVLVFHYTAHLAGALEDHLLLFGIRMSGSSLSQRRQSSPWEVFDQLMRLLFQPVARVGDHAEGFFCGLRLVALDGVEFSLLNTEDINGQVYRRKTRRGRSAFAKLRCSVMVELMHSNPLAAELARNGESEWALSLKLLDRVPEHSLVLLDRLYGCPAFLGPLKQVLQAHGGHYLARVKGQPKVQAVKRTLSDGSRIVEVGLRDPESRSQIIDRWELREIVVRAQRPGCRPVTVRLWTSLLDEVQAPARVMAQLYMSRWEQELFFRELKENTRSGRLLRSQTLETACQEVAAMLAGMSILARERAKLQAGQEPGYKISFRKTWGYLEALWTVMEVSGHLLSAEQRRQMVEGFAELMRHMRTPKRRDRSCPRAVRKPVQRWPRKLRQPERLGPIQLEVLSTPLG